MLSPRVVKRMASIVDPGMSHKQVVQVTVGTKKKVVASMPLDLVHKQLQLPLQRPVSTLSGNRLGQTLWL